MEIALILLFPLCGCRPRQKRQIRCKNAITVSFRDSFSSAVGGFSLSGHAETAAEISAPRRERFTVIDLSIRRLALDLLGKKLSHKLHHAALALRTRTLRGFALFIIEAGQ